MSAPVSPMAPSRRMASAVARAARALVEPLEERKLMYSATVGVNTNTTFQTMDGFGAAMMTWTRPSEYSQAAFYDKIVGDLGASIARTAIWPTHEKANDNNDPNTFNWAGYDKNALGLAMTFLKRLQDRGMNQFLATMWAPPPWMKTNQSHYYGGTIRPDMREEFAENVAAAVISAQRDFGVNLTHVSPQNEPFFVQEFESATYTDVQMREIVRAVMRKLDAEGLGTQIIAPEEMAKAERYDWYADAIMNDPETRNFPGAWGVHSATNPDWSEVGDIVENTGHNIWSTESHGHAQTIDGALGMAQDIFNALTQANASAYLYWQWSADADDGQHSLMVDGQPAIKYHVAKHFYRYVRPGAIRIGATSSDARLRTLSFKHPQTGAVTHVLFNPNGDNANATINLSGSGLPSTYKAYRTSGTENHVQLANVAGGSRITLTLPANSIVTLYSGPDLVTTPSTSGGSLPSKQDLADGSITNALRIAAAKGDAGDVRELIDNQGADPNASAFGGYTPLHAAAMSPYAGATDVINALLQRGASTTAKTTEGFTPLHFAAMNVWTRGSTTATPLAADKIRALTAGGASVTAKDNAGRTPLHWGAMMTKLANITTLVSDRAVVDALLDAGSAVNANDNNGWTPLDYAVREGNSAGATELKNRGGVHGAGAPNGDDTTPPTSDVVDVSPDPRTTAVNSVDVIFSEPVTGVDLADFILQRDGGNQSLAGATVTQVNSTTWRVGNLGPLTGQAGSYLLKLEKAGSGITDAAGNALSTSASDSWTLSTGPGTPPDGQQPFKGSPFAVGATPVTIQAEDFDLGGQGVAYNDTTANNIGGLYRAGEAVDIKSQASGQFRISDGVAGEWLEYTIDVATSGDYELEFRVSHADPNSRFHAEVDGVNVTGSLTVPDTNSFNTFASVKKTVALTSGQHVLRFAFDANAANGYAAGFDWVKVTAVTSNPPNPGTPQTVTTPIVTYVRDGASANTNFGVNDEMLVKRSNTVGNTREGWISFDLSSFASISNAKLRLYGRLSDATAPSVQVNVLSSANTSWTEGGLTWNNKPAVGTTAHGAVVVSGTTNQWYEVDLTSFLQSEFAAGRKTVSLVLRAPSVSNPWAIFGTDSTPNGPRMVITP